VRVFALQTLDAHGGTMRIENASDDVKQVFSLTGLLKVFDIK
jgi:anti-anti-sigma regulatory factor